MREYILQQLRECSCVRGKQRTWVSDLTDEQLYELFLRLRSGDSCKAIARFIQNGWGVLPESSVHSVSQGLIKFKRRIAHLLETPITEREDRCAGPTTGNSAPESTLDALDEIAKITRARIKGILREEEKTGVKYPFLNRDLQALASLQKVIMKQEVFEKFHDSPAKLRRLAGLDEKIGQGFGAVMNEIGEDGRFKIVKALDRFMELAKEHAQPAEIGPDGKLRLVESKK